MVAPVKGEDKRTVFPAGFVLLMPHHQGFTSSIYLILFGPPTHAPLFMHYVKNLKLLTPPPTHTLTIYYSLLPTSPNLSLPHLPPNSLLIFFFPFLSPGPSPCFYPFHPVKVCVAERGRREFVWVLSFSWIDCQHGQ